MTEIELDGKKYISSKRAAEITKYTKDYIGQLARAGKINARLVGRCWYVDEQSVVDHQNGVSDNRHHEVLSAVSDSPHGSSGTAEDSPIYKSEIHEANVESINFQKRDYIISHEIGESADNVQPSSPQESQEIIRGESKFSDELKATGSAGWRSLWGVPVYESDDRALLPSTKKNSIETADEGDRMLDEEVELVTRDIKDFEPAQEYVAPTRRASEFRRPEAIRMTSNANTMTQTINNELVKASNTSKSSNKRYVAAGLAAVVVSVIVLVFYSVLGGSTNNNGLGGDSNKSRYFGSEFHYSR